MHDVHIAYDAGGSSARLTEVATDRYLDLQLPSGDACHLQRGTSAAVTAITGQPTAIAGLVVGLFRLVTRSHELACTFQRVSLLPHASLPMPAG